MTESQETDQQETDEPPAGPPPRPRARERGRMRRRLRQQRSVREALLLDLGALVFELHRHGRREPELLQAKAAELTGVDVEVRALSQALDQDLGIVELVAAGIAGTCPECGSLLSTDARFCATCGLATTPGLRARDTDTGADAIAAAPDGKETAAQDAVEVDPSGELPEAPDEQMVAADLGDEPEAYAQPEQEIVTEPEPDVADGEEPGPEPEPGEVESPEPAAPWLEAAASRQTETAAPEAEPDTPEPEPLDAEPPDAEPAAPDTPEPDAPPPAEPHRVRRRQSRLERALRGRGRQ